jgi:hypothetical protein
MPGPGRRFPPGVSGNPAGRPGELRGLARRSARSAFERVLDVMMTSDDRHLQLRAAELILALARGGPLPAPTLDLRPLDGPALEPLDVEEMTRPTPPAAASAGAATEGPQEAPGAERDEV